MVNTQKIAQSLTGLIGLYPGLSANGIVPAAFHRQAVAYLSDAHKLLRPEILSALGPNLADINPAPFVAQTVYCLYEVVASDGKYYEKLTGADSDNLNDGVNWRETTLLSAWYSRIERGSITKLAMACTAAPPPKPLLENQALYTTEGNSRDTVNKNNRFVGLRLRVRGNGVAMGILRVGLQVTGAIANFPVYLYHSSQNAPVGVAYLDGTTIGRTVWVDFPQTLYGFQDGYFLIGYYESLLPLNVFAVGAIRGFNLANCSSCGGADVQLVRNRSNFLSIDPVQVAGPLVPGTMTWAQDQELQVVSQSFGINLIIKADCDATAEIINNKAALSNALLYMVACDVLEEISTSDRVNSLVENMTTQAYIALNGQTGNKDGGLKAERTKAVDDLKSMLTRLNPQCMSTPVRQGIRWGSTFD